MADYTNISKEFADGSAREGLRQRSTLEHGTRSALPVFYRYVILDVVSDPASIDRVKLNYWEHDLGVSNIQHAHAAPRNSIIAKRVQSNTTSVTDQTLILYPFLPPNLSLPCNPGEQVWVIFEDQEGTRNDLGYWMWRIVGPSFAEDVNHTHHHRAHDPAFVKGTKDSFQGRGSVPHEFRNGSVGDVDGERYAIAESASLPDLGHDAYENILTDSDAAKLSHMESVPRFRKRPGDVVLEGTNNSLIVLGRDRVNSIAEYDSDQSRGNVPKIPDSDVQEDGAGSIDVVVGRGQTPRTGGNVVQNSLNRNELAKDQTNLVPEEGDPDLRNDRSRIALFQKTRLDANLELDQFNVSEFSISDERNGEGGIVIKSDKLRFIARSDVEIVVKGGARDSSGRFVDGDDTSSWAALVIKANGDIVIRPAENGVIKLGADDADKAIVCTDVPAINNNGQVVQSSPLITTMGGMLLTGVSGQGAVASKVLIK